MPAKEKTPVVKPKARAKVKATAKAAKEKPESSPLDKLPATFTNWKDGESQIIASLDLHVYTLARHDDAFGDKLTRMAEEEIAKVVLLLRKRIKARSKKMDLGCRVM